MSNAIDRLLETSHRIDTGRARGLDARELRDLRAVASGEREHPSRVRAMAMLAIADADQARDVLLPVVRGRREAPVARAAAASVLGRVGGDEVERTMTDAVATEEDSTVRLELVTALGKIGGHRAAERLRQLAENDAREEVRKQAAFAHMLVAHRDGGERVEPPAPEAGRPLPPRDATNDFGWNRAGDDEVRHVVDTLHGDDYGVDVARARGFAVECPPARFVVLLDGALSDGNVLDVAARRPAIAGLVTERSPVGETYSVRWTILTGPEPAEDDAAYVAVYRTDGVLAFRGGLSRDADAARFSLAANDVPGNLAVDVQGRVGGGDVALERRRAGRRIAQTRSPSAFTMPGR